MLATVHPDSTTLLWTTKSRLCLTADLGFTFQFTIEPHNITFLFNQEIQFTNKD
jgi:hypothetical protein